VVGRENSVAIIDDDASLCRSLARLLRLNGFEPRSFSSAEEFLSYPERAQFGCALVDVQLGGMSGIEMQRALNAQGERLPVIFVTAHDEPAVRAEAVQGGCAGFCRKSDDGARIMDTVRQVTKS
jgi:FixJ family two-component response regulator